MRGELLVSDLRTAFGPAEAVNTVGDIHHWRSVSYRSGQIRGNMLSALGDCFPEDVSFDPALTGWYRIYVGLPTLAEMEVWLRLSDDSGIFRLMPMNGQCLSITRVEEVLWRCCDMTGQKIFLTRSGMQPAKVRHSMLAWLRFVPMDEEEVKAHLAERNRKDTKRIYATDDIHNRLLRDDLSGRKTWDSVIVPYEDSDVEWLSLEDVACFTGGSVPTDTPEAYAFKRDGDRNAQHQSAQFNSVAVLKELVQKGKAKGLSMSVSLRMGAWTMGFPFDQCYFDNPFFFQNQHLQCVDRDGTVIPSLSYAFEEVQQYMIDRLVTLAGTGSDAVTLIAHRGGPYLLFEEPVVKKFTEKYGEVPHTRPLDDPELMDVRCGIMTDFFIKLRAALDCAFPNRRVQIHLRALVSVYDTKYFGIDCVELAERGLVDAIISYPQRFRETISDTFFHDGRICLKEYADYFYNTHGSAYYHENDTDLVSESVLDSAGIPRTPASLRACVQEWMELERSYSVKIYLEIMPRIMGPERMRNRALELYECGAGRFGLWDTYDRVACAGMWAVAGKLGHKDELIKMDSPYYRVYRIHEIAGMNISRNHPSWGG